MLDPASDDFAVHLAEHVPAAPKPEESLLHTDSSVSVYVQVYNSIPQEQSSLICGPSRVRVRHTSVSTPSRVRNFRAPTAAISSVRSSNLLSNSANRTPSFRFDRLYRVEQPASLPDYVLLDRIVEPLFQGLNTSLVHVSSSSAASSLDLLSASCETVGELLFERILDAVNPALAFRVHVEVMEILGNGRILRDLLSPDGGNTSKIRMAEVKTPRKKKKKKRSRRRLKKRRRGSRRRGHSRGRASGGTSLDDDELFDNASRKIRLEGLFSLGVNDANDLRMVLRKALRSRTAPAEASHVLVELSLMRFRVPISGLASTTSSTASSIPKLIHRDRLTVCKLLHLDLCPTLSTLDTGGLIPEPLSWNASYARSQNTSYAAVSTVVSDFGSPTSYRLSKLTHLLSDVLAPHANSLTSVLAAVSGTRGLEHATLSTLRLAASMRKISTSPLRASERGLTILLDRLTTSYARLHAKCESQFAEEQRRIEEAVGEAIQTERREFRDLMRLKEETLESIRKAQMKQQLSRVEELARSVEVLMSERNESQRKVELLEEKLREREQELLKARIDHLSELNEVRRSSQGEEHSLEEKLELYEEMIQEHRNQIAEKEQEIESLNQIVCRYKSMLEDAESVREELIRQNGVLTVQITSKFEDPDYNVTDDEEDDVEDEELILEDEEEGREEIIHIQANPEEPEMLLSTSTHPLLLPDFDARARKAFLSASLSQIQREKAAYVETLRRSLSKNTPTTTPPFDRVTSCLSVAEEESGDDATVKFASPCPARNRDLGDCETDVSD